MLIVDLINTRIYLSFKFNIWLINSLLFNNIDNFQFILFKFI